MHDDFRPLAEFLVGLSQQYLDDEGAFPVSGAALNPDGGVVALKAYDGPGYEEQEAQLALLEQVMRKHVVEGKYRATGVCLDVKVRGEDAILVALERDGEALDAFYPYRLGDDTGGDQAKTALGRPFGSHRAPRVFVEPEAH